jgi:TRAP transporter 4TM/12TM fusion protein
MVEYVGIPYSEIIKHAALPAIISYVALFYIVHLEALKYGMQPIPRGAPSSLRDRFIEAALGIAGTVAAVAVIYYGVTTVQRLFGDSAGWVLAILTGGGYLGLLAYSARFPDLPMDDPKAPVIRLPELWPTVRAGFHFLVPLVVLLWCLMVEELSPGLSAFWATVTVIATVVVQPPLLALLRRQGEIGAALRRGLGDLWKGLVLGARNMIGIGVATASAGLIVGAITLTGMGFMMTEFVEYVSAGNVLVMLVFTAIICLLIGAGVPTTANYILVATIMAPVIVELGAQSGLVIPLIAVHLFVFYFGIMADVTPPVGLASYAAAAISGDDPNATGWQATWYSFRTAILPFVFVFNPQILFIGVHSWWEVTLVSVTATVAALLFAAATMAWFRTRCNTLEIALLLLATFLFFRPDWVVDYVQPEYVSAPAKDLYRVADGLAPDQLLVLGIRGENIEGEEIRKVVALPMGPGRDGRERIRNAGVTLVPQGEDIQVAAVKFGSLARKLGLDQGYVIAELKLPNPARPSPYWVFIPGALVALLVWWWQGVRQRPVALSGRAVP